MEEQRAQTCEQQRRGNGKASQRGHEHRRAKHGEHVLEAQNEQLSGGCQRAGIADTLVLHGDISFVNMRFTRDRPPRISSHIIEAMAPKARKNENSNGSIHECSVTGIQQVIAERIDDGGVAVMADAPEIVLISFVNVAVHHIARWYFFHHIQKGFEPGVPDRCRRRGCARGEWVIRISMPPLRQI